MTSRRFILDCDPGQDDAIAILLALGSHELAFEAITIVAGNVGADQGAANARRILDLAGADRPIYRGAPRALLKPYDLGERFHGGDGLMGLDLPPPSRPPEAEHAVSFLARTLLAAEPGSIDLACVGPLTNLALLLIQYPDAARGLGRVAIMGGAIGLGNVSPAAEFNIHSDAAAAAVVFSAGLDVILVPLDLTHQALGTDARIAALKATGRPTALAVAELLARYPRLEKFNYQGGPLHDPCAVAALIWPEMVSGRHVAVEIDASGGPSHGRTLVHWWPKSTGPRPNALVLSEIDADQFYHHLSNRV